MTRLLSKLLIGPLAFAGLVLAAGTAEPAYAPCTGRATILVNQTVDRTMTVRAGKSCSVSLRSSKGPTFGATIIERPKHGRASVSGHRVTYTANAGYVGADSFIYARTGVDERNNPKTNTVRVTVTVTP